MITSKDLPTLPEGDQLTKGSRNWFGVHMGHCCVTHGCSYRDDDCPVVNGTAKQDDPCEECDKHEDHDTVRNHWLRHYANGGPLHLCTLCGNTGMVDTTLTAIPPNGGKSVGKRQPCFCPNGRAIRMNTKEVGA